MSNERLQAVDYQEWTLTIGGRGYDGWSETSIADHQRPTGRYAQAGGDIVTKSRTITGGRHTFTKRYDRTEFARLKADWLAGNDEATGVQHEVDRAGRPVATLARMTGVMADRPKVADRRPDGTPMTMQVAITADGRMT